MFDDIGGQCKLLAKVILWVGIIVSVFLGILMMIFGNDIEHTFSKAPIYMEESSAKGIMYLGIAVMVLGPLVSFVASVAFYALGQVVENTNELLSRKNAQYAQGSSAQQKGNVKEKTQLRGLSKEFVNEIINTDTEDLKLIVQDQRELYTAEEFNFIKKQLSNRTR